MKYANLIKKNVVRCVVLPSKYVVSGRQNMLYLIIAQPQKKRVPKKLVRHPLNI